MTGPSIDAQIAAVKTALAAASSPTESALLKAAVRTLEQVRADRRRGAQATNDLANIVRGK